jgi:hypothetical protein
MVYNTRDYWLNLFIARYSKEHTEPKNFLTDPTPSPEDGNRPSFRNVVYFGGL